MNALRTNAIPLTKHLNPDRGQALLAPPTIQPLMRSRHTCPCCATVLLRHMRLGGLYWYCRHCYEDLPV